MKDKIQCGTTNDDPGYVTNQPEPNKQHIGDNE